MLCVCVVDVMDVVFSVCIVRLYVLVHGKCERFVIQMLCLCLV